MKQKIKILLNYLKRNNFKKESSFLFKIGSQIDDALDPTPFEIMLPSEIKISEEDSLDNTEQCRLVNFGIDVLQKPNVVKNMKKKTPFFNENIRFIHFDLMKIIKCMDINEQSYTDLKELFFALSQYSMGLTSNLSKNKFLKIFDKFKKIQNVFKEKLSDSDMNYILIGSSDTSKNFIGTEVGAVRFHQNSIRHIVHDLGHASYDVQGMKRSYFKPIYIISQYLVDIFDKYDEYLIYYNMKNGLSNNDRLKTIDFSPFARGEVNTGLSGSINSLVSHLRKNKKYYDIRYLVGTTSYTKEDLTIYKPKMFTDKSDYDQDIFSYIMLSKSENISNIFKNPILPEKMENFFDNLLGEPELKNEFLNFIESKHKTMIKDVQENMDAVTKEYGGYITYLASLATAARDSAGIILKDNDYKQNIFMFNMLASSLQTVEYALAKRLRSKGYAKPGDFALYQKGDSNVIANWARYIKDSIVIDAKSGEKGNLAILNITDDISKRVYNNFKKFGNYRMVGLRDNFYVSEEYLKEFITMPERLYSDNVIIRKSEVYPEYPYELVIVKTGGDLNKFVAMFFPSLDKSSLRTSLSPIKPFEDKSRQSLATELDIKEKEFDIEKHIEGLENPF